MYVFRRTILWIRRWTLRWCRALLKRTAPRLRSYQMIPSNIISWCCSMTSCSGNCVACRTTLLLAMHDPSRVSTLRFLATGYCLQCLGRHLREMKVVLTLSQQTPLVGCMIAPLRWFYSPWCLAARTVHWLASLLWHPLDCQLRYREGVLVYSTVELSTADKQVKLCRRSVIISAAFCHAILAVALMLMWSFLCG